MMQQNVHWDYKTTCTCSTAASKNAMLDLKKQFSPLPWCCCCTAVVPLVPQGLLSSLTTNAPSQRPSEQRPSRLFATEGWEGEADVSDWEPFRLLGRSMVDYIADYYQGVESLPVRARVEPGYLKVERDIKRTAGRISRRTCAYCSPYMLHGLHGLQRR